VAEQFASMHAITTVSLAAPSHQWVCAMQLAHQSQRRTLVTHLIGRLEHATLCGTLLLLLQAGIGHQSVIWLTAEH